MYYSSSIYLRNRRQVLLGFRSNFNLNCHD
jgi:hypothetical protein